MKKIILAAILGLVAVPGYSQYNVWGFYAGAGASLNYNYDVGITGGFTFMKQGIGRAGLGGDLIYQGIPLKYDREAYGKKNHTGPAGVIVKDDASYFFIAPKINQSFGRFNTLEAYLSFGVGFKVGGTETLHKWDSTHGYVGGVNYYDYDSTINSSNNINSMVFRIGAGMTEFVHMGYGENKWWFTISENLSFIPTSITKTTDITDPSHTQYSPSKLNPFFISLTIGVSHAKAHVVESRHH